MSAPKEFVDFGTSFFTWKTITGSFGRFNIESVLKFENKNYLLGSKVIAANVYSTGNLFIEPSYDYQFVSGESDHIIKRDIHGGKIYDTNGEHSEQFKKIETKIEYFAHSALTDQELIGATKAYLKLGAVIKLVIDNVAQTLIFPIKHINYNSKNEFQAETGPLLIFTGNKILRRAFVAFNSFSKCELITENITDEKRTFKDIIRTNCKIQVYSY